MPPKRDWRLPGGNKQNVRANFLIVVRTSGTYARVQIALTTSVRPLQPTHCIKMTGVFDGKLGTKRFCSSKTWGNYCEYNKRPGDVQVRRRKKHRTV